MALPNLKLADDTNRKPTRRLTFTLQALGAIPTPLKGRVQVADTKTPGLVFRITPNGARAFYFYKKIQGRPTRIKLADYGTVSLEQVRKLALKMLSDIAAGINPAQERRQARACSTLGELYAIYRDTHAQAHNRHHTRSTNDCMYRNHLARWAGRPLDSITRLDIENLVRNVGKTSPVSANRTLQFLSRLFNWAALHGYNKPNPCKHAPKFKEPARARYLEGAELGRFLLALEDAPPLMRDFLLLALLTGARRSNVESMAWAEIDFARAIWTIPPQKSKTNTTLELPLSTPAMDILTRRRREADTQAQYVFPARYANAKTPHLQGPRAPFMAVCARAGITGLRIHDLRRTVASVATNLGVPYPTVAAMLGHVARGITSVYARPTPDAVRQAFERTAAAIMATKATVPSGVAQ